MNRLGFLASSAALIAPPRVAQAQAPIHITLGDDVFLSHTWHELGKRSIGIVTNQTGVTANGEAIVDAVRRRTSVSVKALFAPEHGLRGDRPAGAYVPSYVDPASRLPVYSLYGATRRPSAEMLSGIDVLVFDIQDVGARAYTFISTMAYVMQAAAQHGKEIWILDRPNPIGGAMVEGPVLEPEYRSFIGLYPIAMRHGMTVGELAQMFNDAFGIHAKLRVIPMRGWQRTMLWDATGLSWVQSSPNIPSWHTALLYPCTGLVASAGLNN
ncbi:MAG: exo-beta-N-acetylmuramidase NamZ family protein, partial [Vulcanimicrobiaceae bacterium]